MAEAQLANAFFANEQGALYFRNMEACTLNEDMGMVYIKQEDNGASTPISVLVPISRATICRSSKLSNSRDASRKREAIDKFQKAHRSKDRNTKFQQYLRFEEADGYYSGTIHAIYDRCVVIKFRIDKPAKLGLRAWPVTNFVDEAFVESKGRKYLTRQYDIDKVLEAFHLWKHPEEDEAVSDDIMPDQEHVAGEAHRGDDLIEKMKSIETLKTENVSDLLTKIAKSLDTKDLAGILARCFDATSASEDMKSIEASVEEKKAIVEELKLLAPKSEVQLALNEKQSQVVKFPLHCPVTFQCRKLAEVQGVSYNMVENAYRYKIKLNGSGFSFETNETSLAFAPHCSVLYKGDGALIVSASKCSRKEYSVKCNGDEAIYVAVSEDDLKFDPTSYASSVEKDKIRAKWAVKNDSDASITSPVVEKIFAPKASDSSTKHYQVIPTSPMRTDLYVKGKRKLDIASPSPVRKCKVDPFYEPIIRRENNGFVIETPSMRKGLSFRKLAESSQK